VSSSRASTYHHSYTSRRARQVRASNSIEWIHENLVPASCSNLYLSIPLNGFYTLMFHVQCGEFSHLHYMDSIPLSPQAGLLASSVESGI
jgi:hypothetical protein